MVHRLLSEEMKTRVLDGIGVSGRLLVTGTHVQFFYILCAFRFKWHPNIPGQGWIVWGQENETLQALSHHVLPSPRLTQTGLDTLLDGHSWARISLKFSTPKYRTPKKSEKIRFAPKPQAFLATIFYTKRQAASSIANITAGAPAARYTAKALRTRPRWDGDDGDSGSGFSSGSDSTTWRGPGNSRKAIGFDHRT